MIADALVLLLAVFVFLHAVILYGLSRRIGDLEAWRDRYSRHDVIGTGTYDDPYRVDDHQ